MQPKVYSYTRFSDPRQSSGHSLERQTDYARKWAHKRGLAVDESLCMKDEGLSAYHEQHVKQGALGVFLEAIKAGKISSGSFLIVESLDRLSRAQPLFAQSQLTQIVSAGITVVTAADNKEYGLEQLKSDPTLLLYAIIVMTRAHEESERKSQRVTDQIIAKCRAWQDGTFRGKIRNGCDPDWVAWNGKEFILIPERANAVAQMVDMFILGHGATVIQKRLRELGQYFEKGNIYNIVRREDLIGFKVMAVTKHETINNKAVISKEEFRLAGYFPPVISVEKFQELQQVVQRRTRQKGKGDIPGLITGIKVTTCGYCGYTVVSNNLMSSVRKKPDGTPLDGHRRLKCCGQNGKCTVAGTTGAVAVESAILNFCSDQMNLTSLLRSDDAVQNLNTQKLSIESQIAKAQQKQTRLMDVMFSTLDEPPELFTAKARELEGEISTMKERLRFTNAELMKASNTDAIQNADKWQAVAKGALALDYDDRMTARRLIEDTFKQIVLYGRGITPNPDSEYVDLLLIPHFGNQRLITISRKTGEWHSGMELTQELNLPFLQ